MDSTLQELSNGTKKTQIGVRMTKLWSYKVGAKTGKLQTSRRFNVAALQRAAETQHPEVATLTNDVATLGFDFGWIFSPF